MKNTAVKLKFFLEKAQKGHRGNFLDKFNFTKFILEKISRLRFGKTIIDLFKTVASSDSQCSLAFVYFFAVTKRL